MVEWCSNDLNFTINRHRTNVTNPIAVHPVTPKTKQTSFRFYPQRLMYEKNPAKMFEFVFANLLFIYSPLKLIKVFNYFYFFPSKHDTLLKSKYSISCTKQAEV